MNQQLPPTALRAIAAYRKTHGATPTVLARAPGRVNLIGEHTDYNDGFVLPAAIDRDTWVAAGPRAGHQVHAIALDEDEANDFFALGPSLEPLPEGGWRNHVRGVLAQLHEVAALPGMNVVIAGDVPMGAGLSSSASLALALLTAAQRLAGVQLEGERLARLAQRSEHVFVGCQCGIMDQLASAMGQEGHALMIDCRSLRSTPVPLPPGTVLLIAHSRVRRGLVDSAYNERRAQCEEAARTLGVPALRDATLQMLQAATLPDTVHRRARHVITENDRVLQAAAALQQHDLAQLGELMAASHRSMRDDFEITTPAIDRLAELLQQVAGREGGARMTGGGFGGCVIALLRESRVPAALATLESSYRSPEGLPALTFLCRAAPGARAFGCSGDLPVH